VKSLFSFKDYKAYLAAVESGGTIRAFRTQVAKAAACQNAYVSQVLNGPQHFSLEQTDGIAGLLSLTLEEKSFLILLVQYARAGTSSLRQFFNEQIQQAHDQHLLLSNRLNANEAVDDRDQLTYYSEWYYSAIHVLVTIARFRTRESIAERLQLPLTTVKRATEFLLACGLLDEKKGELVTGRRRLHLPGNSPHVAKHHTNWRLQAMQSLSEVAPLDMHYSAAVTISNDDVEKIREILIQAVSRLNDTVRDSVEEDIFAFAMDFYRL
jgi:uncharacterized protein (TIGR02147 family)